MGLQEFPSKPVNKGGVVIGTINGPTEVAIGAQDSYLVADSTATPGAKWQTYRKYNTVQLTSGTSWTVPATVESIDVLLIGGGQGGAGVSTSATANNANSEVGGAGGAIIFMRDYPVTPGASISYSIGSGGSAGTNPAPTASTRNWGGNGGNTTFGVLVAPGGNSRYGSSTLYTGSNAQRGVFAFDSLQTFGGNSARTSSNNFELGGVPVGQPNALVIGALANTTTSAVPFMYPHMNNSNSFQNGLKYTGITKDFHKILAAYTAPTGSAATSAELTANTTMSGWGGFGGNGTATGAPYVAETGYHGAGAPGSINNSTTGSNRASVGGAAATNSGAGGGGSAAITGSAAVFGAAGSAGGSGVIFIGYWA